MSSFKDNGPIVSLKKRATLYVYTENCAVDYAASLTAAYDRDDFCGFRILASELECCERALSSLMERAFLDLRDSYVRAIKNTDKLTPDILNMNLDLAAYNGNMAGMAIWISLGADVLHHNGRAFASAIIGAQEESIVFLKARGCTLTQEVFSAVDMALKRPDLQNADSVRRQLQALRMQSCARQPALLLV